MKLFKRLSAKEKNPGGQAGKLAASNGADELNTILDHIPMAVYWKDATLTYRGCNEQFGAIAGIACKDVPGKTDMEINAKESAELFRKEDMEFLSGKRKEMYFTDKLIFKKDNTSIWVRTYKIPIFNDDKKIEYIMGLIQDVTKIKQDEIALAEGESRLRTILNATDDRIVFVDFFDKVLVANGSFMYDFAPGITRIAGKQLSALIAPQFFQKMHEHMNMAVKTGKPHSFDLSPEESQTSRYFDVAVYPVTTDDGVIGTAIFARDITERKRTEEMLIKRGEELEKAITEAENASKAKSEFLSRMSHEIRTPIGAITGMAKIAADTDDIVKIKDCLRKIDSSSKHLLGIINDVLDMSKIEADRFVLSNDVFRFENMFMDVADVVSVQADEKRQNFEIILDEMLPEYFCADELRLRQVITNLISNAIKFTPEYGTIRVNANNIGMDGEVATVEITVSDTGIGLSKEQRKRLFQPFEQADGGISRKYGGTGLGLVICKKIAEMMDGSIRVESEPNAGSKFIVNVKMQVHYAETSKPGKSIQFADMRALVVDDSPETREYLSSILAKFEIRCETAQDGFEAVNKVQQAKDRGEAFNVFFIDWLMPGMDGVETTRKVKSIMDDNAVVIMISIIEWDRIKDKATEAGVAKFIPKPLFPSVILSALDEIAGTSPEYDVNVSKKGAPNLSGCRILLAEDIEINREIAAALLAPTKAEIDFAFNGKEAVEKFNAARESYDIILMDLHMPEMNGYEATKLIRANEDEKSKTIPIMAMTADAFKEDIEKCEAVGMNDHIAKPINEAELFKKLLNCQVLARQSIARAEAQKKLSERGVKITELYIDEKEALDRLGGNKELYVKLLNSFLAGTSCEKLRQSMTDGDAQAAQFEAHSLKGMAANLSLKILYAQATALDAQLKNGTIDMTALAAIEQAAQKTAAHIGEYLSKNQ